ncbi:serine protease [Geranomyces variabilis]|uniref:Serine protease n=1 Tax=Geranomyces variabilis TaxID=109894 RepID=A0AAD5XPM3_9FUNG|nr:serine protease [Geranomyces variabilis]
MHRPRPSLLTAFVVSAMLVHFANGSLQHREEEPVLMNLDAFLPHAQEPSSPPAAAANRLAGGAPAVAASSPAAPPSSRIPDLLASILANAPPPTGTRERGSQAPQRYIVMLQPNMTQSDVQAHLDWLKSQLSSVIPANSAANALVDRYAGVLTSWQSTNGYAAHVPAWLVDQIKLRAGVHAVEPDVYLTHMGDMSENPSSDSGNSNAASDVAPDAITATAPVAPTTGAIQVTAAGLLATSAEKTTAQALPPWGLDRISHRESGFQGLYIFPPNGGENVDIYVLDTGVYAMHPDFEGRARIGTSFSPDGSVDGHGHGTHVSGTAASKTYGVAKKANVIGVKVLDNDGKGLVSQVISGLDWVLTEIGKKNATTGATRRSVVNMSLGGAGQSTALNALVSRLVQAGVPIAVAAGNDNVDACTNSPADSALAMTVGASTMTDSRATFSNYGPCVNIFGPGSNITSTYIPPASTHVLSGTSMATPHVAGLMATLLSQYPAATPADVYSTLDTLATPNMVADANTPTAKLLFSGLDNQPYDGLVKAKKNFPWMVWDLVRSI